MRNNHHTGCVTDTFEDAVAHLAERIEQVSDMKLPDSSDLGFRRIEVDIEPVDPLLWLSSQQSDQKIYWQDREGRSQVAGIGVADTCDLNELEELQLLIDRLEHCRNDSESSIRYFGGLRFDSNEMRREHRGEWQAYGNGRLVLPRFELISQPCGCHLACNFANTTTENVAVETIVAELHDLVFDIDSDIDARTFPTSREDLPNREDWNTRVKHVLDSVASDHMQKIVLARRSLLTFDSPLNSWLLLRHLRETSISSYLFGFQPEQGTVFIGASPERLYRRVGREVESEALAGTRPRNSNNKDLSSIEDEKLAEELLLSDKDRHEHEVVADAIQKKLQPLCRVLQRDDSVTVRKLTGVQHLARCFRGTLQPYVTDLDLLHNLHPTPAVSGYPKDRALAEIAQLEPFDRGWYAGPVGWIGCDKAEFAVGIRSGLVNTNNLMLYSGAGIVQGSTSEGEWDEIEMKLDSFLRAVTRS